jgi:hypothetical protein
MLPDATCATWRPRGPYPGRVFQRGPHDRPKPVDERLHRTEHRLDLDDPKVAYAVVRREPRGRAKQSCLGCRFRALRRHSVGRTEGPCRAQARYARSRALARVQTLALGLEGLALRLAACRGAGVRRLDAALSAAATQQFVRRDTGGNRGQERTEHTRSVAG